MHEPIVHEGEIDWEPFNEAADRVQREDGSINWRAAFMADPGLMSCPGCGEYLWKFGIEVECPGCGHRWRRDDG